MSRDTPAPALKSWPSWLWSWNSHNLSCRIHHFSPPNSFFVFLPFRMFEGIWTTKSRPTFWRDFSSSVWPQIFNNGNCRYWKFYYQNPAKTKIETRLLNVTFSNFVPFHREEQRHRKDFWQFTVSRPPPTPSTKCDIKAHVLRYLISESTCFEKWNDMFSDFPFRVQWNSAPKTQNNLFYQGLFCPHRHEVRKSLSLSILFLVDIQQKCLLTIIDETHDLWCAHIKNTRIHRQYRCFWFFTLHMPHGTVFSHTLKHMSDWLVIETRILVY